MKRLAVASLVLALTACTPGMYSGGGWTDVEGIETHATFGFNVDNCGHDVVGVFNFKDSNWEKPVNITGHILDFGDLDFFQGECGYFALLEYTSLAEGVPGTGHAVACFTEDDTHVEFSVQSGPLKGYEQIGVVDGVLVEHECK